MKAGTLASRFKTAVTAVVCAGLFSPGCAARRVESWTPKPLVHWQDLTTYRVPWAPDTYRILAVQPTRGLFPSSLAVTRVGVVPAETRSAKTRPVLLTDPRNEFLQWYSAVDDQMAVSEVFSVVQSDLGGRSVSPEQILAAIRALHARLGLVYAVNELSSQKTEMLAVLYDTLSSQPIASLHASAVSAEPARGRKKTAVDLWKSDSRALARAKFQSLLHACIRELISRDEPAVLAVPTGYAPGSRRRTVEWPPRGRRRQP